MPTPWKTARLASLISRLRSKRRGSLVVQTGFPTSLADLVVKNRSRLKPPTRRSKKPLTDPAPAPAPAPAPVRPPPDLDPTAADGTRRISSPAAAKRQKIGGQNLGRSKISFLVVKLVALAVLAIGKKEFVVGITISAIAIRVLEFLGIKVFGFLKQGLDERNDGFELVRLESVSPIREIEPVDFVEELRVERRIEKSPVLDSECEVLSKRRELDDRERRNGGSAGNSKVKKLWKKIFRKKSRWGKRKELVSSSDDGRLRVCNREVEEVCNQEEEEEEVGNEEDEEEVDEEEDVCREITAFENTDQSSFVDAKDISSVIVENAGGSRLGSYRNLVFFLVVLFGLLGGRVVALVLTLAWYLLSRCTETVWKKWKMKLID